MNLRIEDLKNNIYSELHIKTLRHVDKQYILE